MHKRMIVAAVAAVLTLGAASAVAGPAPYGPSRFDRRESDPSRFAHIVLGRRCRAEDDLGGLYLYRIHNDTVWIGCRRH